MKAKQVPVSLRDIALFPQDVMEHAPTAPITYFEEGSLAFHRETGGDGAAGDGMGLAADGPAMSPCSLADLNGSWYLRITEQRPAALTHIRGPMRIEAAPARLRISGDVYVSPTLTRPPPLIPATTRLYGRNWYPQLPRAEYAWYFRSTGVRYGPDGRLLFTFTRHVWNPTRSEFTARENAQMELVCNRNNLLADPALPQPTIELRGSTRLGGTVYDVSAIKTSPFYRGCKVDVDVMARRRFPLSAASAGGAALTFESIYRTAGWECPVAIDQTDLAEKAELSTADLNQTMIAHGGSAANADVWRLWLLIGSASAGNFGIMFDPVRRGVAGFFDPRILADPLIAPTIHGKKLGEVAEAFLRTLVHETGHAFNLYHPKHDVHPVRRGTTIMNQTGDVMGLATPAQLYPANVSFVFDEHNRTSLIHSPDPQVAPGWKRFGWGHGEFSAGLSEPLDAAGLVSDDRPAGDLWLDVVLPQTIFRGEFVSAMFVLNNRGTTTRQVTGALNLSQGDLRLLVTPPGGDMVDVRDVTVACGDRPLVPLDPGQQLFGNGQILYTNQGFTFRQTGRYIVSAELDIGDGSGEIARSEPVTIVVRAPATPAEEEIARNMLDPGVGGAFARGDYGMDIAARERLGRLADKHVDTATGVAASLLLANAAGQSLTDLRSGETLRPADEAAGHEHFARAVGDATIADAVRLVLLASAVAAPVEANAPVLEMASGYLRRGAAAEAGADGPARTRGRSKRDADGLTRAAILLEGIRGTLAGL